jgi:uncharacterized protein YjbI with pentapeptide repeats
MADFTREEIEEVIKVSRKFQAANLAGIDLNKADLGMANLIWADLSEASLIMADLSSADLRGAKYNAKTMWPEGFEPEGTGAVLAEDKTGHHHIPTTTT